MGAYTESNKSFPYNYYKDKFVKSNNEKSRASH